ncbi:MAG: hypothetical protein AB1Z23_11900 [Eubacteriales bacterium]
MNETFKNCIPEEIIYLAQKMNASGYRLYIVGGFVRDIFLGSCDTHENDIDVCGDCTPDIFVDIIASDKRIRQCEANFPLGTLKLIIGKMDVEYTCFRTESYRGDGHHTPSEIIFTRDIRQDASRRDFSINALYLDPLTYEVIDFFNGQEDINSKLIKTVRNSIDVFTEDALRLVRMCRFAAKLGFTIEKNTLLGARKCAHLLKNISKERIGVELEKMLLSNTYASYGIDALFSSNISHIICKHISYDTAKKTAIAKNDRFLRWAVFLSDHSSHHAHHFILNLSLGKDLANEVKRIIKEKAIAKKDKDEIILHFAEIGQEAAKRQIEFNNIISSSDIGILQNIFNQMKDKGQFITYETLNIDGNQIIQLLSVKGKQIKYYKHEAYKYAVFNPEKNNYEDLRDYLLSVFDNTNLT